MDKTNLKLQHRIVKLYYKIDKKIAKFNTRLFQKKVRTYGNINKQEFWKLTPKSSSIVPYAVLDKYRNEVTDMCNIQNAYLDEFRYCFRQHEMPQNLNPLLPSLLSPAVPRGPYF